MFGIISETIMVRIILEEINRANNVCCSRGRKYSAFLLLCADGGLRLLRCSHTLQM